MSIIDINEISESMLIAQYVIEMFGAGHFLSRDDYMQVQSWLLLSGSSDELLLVLEAILPRRVEKAREKGKKVFSLASVRKTVEKRLIDRRSLVGGPVHGLGHSSMSRPVSGGHHDS
jgi:glutathione S-transferase